MLGYIEEGGCSCAERRQIRGMWFLAATLPEAGLLCAARRRHIWRQMQKAGVRRAVMPLHLAEEAAKWGIAPVEVFSLRRRMIGAFLDHFGSLQGRAVRLRAPYLTMEVQRAAEELAVRARYLELQMGRGQEELAQHLYYRFGLTVGAVGVSVLTVSFYHAERCQIPLGEDCAALQRVCYRVEGEEGLGENERLLSALFEADSVKKAQIHVKSMTDNA